MDSVVLNLPYPVSVNQMYANQRKVGRVHTKKYRQWIDEAGKEVLCQKWTKIPGAVGVSVVVERRNKNADIDNLIKSTLDLLVRHGVIDDDRNVQRVTAEWGPVKGAQVKAWKLRD